MYYSLALAQAQLLQMIVISILLITTVPCLRLKTHKETPANQLLASQNILLTKIDALLSDIQSPLPAQTDPTKHVLNLKARVLKMRAQFVNLFSYTLIDEAHSNWVCQSNPNLGAIGQQANALGADSTRLNTLLTHSPMYSEQGSIYKTLTSALINQAQSVGTSTPSPLKKRSNLGAQNWISSPNAMASISPHYQRGSLFQDCPLQTPFLTDDGNCFSCPHQYYDLASRKCVDCPDFDKPSYTCLSPTNTDWLSIQTKSIVLVGQKIPADIKGSKTCPPSAPLFNGSACMVCPLLYNVSGLSCATCPPPTLYDSYFKGCVSVSQGNLKGVLLPNDRTVSDVKGTPPQIGLACGTDGEYYDGAKCIGCSSGTYYSLSSSTCVTCPTGQSYDSSSLHCIPIIYYNNLDNNLWLSNTLTPAQLQQTIDALSALPYAVQCPITAPFANGGGCIACPSPMYFSIEEKKCVGCQGAFSQNTHSCGSGAAKITNPNVAPNLILNGHSVNQWSAKYNNALNNNRALASCGAGAPYFDGAACINCPADNPYFNLETMVCQNCIASTSYDAQMRECVSQTGNIATQSPTLEKIAVGIFT